LTLCRLCSGCVRSCVLEELWLWRSSERKTHLHPSLAQSTAGIGHSGVIPVHKEATDTLFCGLSRDMMIFNDFWYCYLHGVTFFPYYVIPEPHTQNENVLWCLLWFDGGHSWCVHPCIPVHFIQDVNLTKKQIETWSTKKYCINKT